MRFPILQHTSERLLRNAAIILIAGFGAGCSANTMRFTDSTFTGSTSNQPVAQQPSSGVYMAPVESAPRVSSGTIRRGSLSPVAEAPLPAPGAGPVPARQSVRAPLVAASGEMHNRVEHTRDLAASRMEHTTRGAEMRVASAATVARGSAMGEKEKVLGQLPVTPGRQGPRPGDNNVAVLPQAPSVNGKKAVANRMASTGMGTTTTPPAPGGYTVQSGDSVYSIAQKHHVSVEELKRANGLSNGIIRVGQSLVIPSGSAPAVTQVAAVSPQPDNPAKAAAAPQSDTTASVKPYTPPQSADTGKNNQSLESAATGPSQLRWPVLGRILASFGQREGTSVSDGIDIMVPEGTPVKAASDGVVIYAGDGLKEFGQTVLIRHDNGLVTVYGNNSQLLVQRGQKVRRGEEIAKSGMSGDAKSPKLHFEVRKNSAPVNPTKYLES